MYNSPITYVFILWEDIDVFGVTFHEIRGVFTDVDEATRGLAEVEELESLYNIRTGLRITVYAVDSIIYGRDKGTTKLGVTLEQWLEWRNTPGDDDAYSHRAE